MSLDIVELFLDEEDFETGIDAISIVENPAIEEDFIALKNQEFKFKKIDEEKKILMGPLLIPNKPIYRKDEDGTEYYIFFSKNTVNKAAQMFLKTGKQGNSTLEHESKIYGLSLVESWIVEDSKMDKSRLYGMDVPLGTWMGAVKVDNENIWNDFVKTGKVKGFSIEGYFADRAQNKNPNGLNHLKSQIIDSERAMIDDRMAYSTEARAKEIAAEIGCKGCHTHEYKNKIWYMPCEKHINEEVALTTLKAIYNKLSNYGKK